MFEDRTAMVTLEATAWSGWDRETYPIVTSTRVRVTKGRALTPETLGKGKPDNTGSGPSSYELLVERIVEDRVGFAYRNLVIENPNGTINLTAPQTGRFILRRGETMKLATATMDAGTSVKLTLDEIR
jgi:hypothetical protein